jgi:hypothetical protein
MEEIQITSRHPERQTGDNRNEQGRFQPGISGNPNGRPPLTQEQKIIRKATREIVKEYREKLAEALPSIEPVLVALALKGDVAAIKELHDRVMGKAIQFSVSDTTVRKISDEKKAEADNAIKEFLNGKN